VDGAVSFPIGSLQNERKWHVRCEVAIHEPENYTFFASTQDKKYVII
jgi:hypothetical protein